MQVVVFIKCINKFIQIISFIPARDAGVVVARFQLYCAFSCLFLVFGFSSSHASAHASVSPIPSWEYTLLDPTDAEDLQTWLKQDRIDVQWQKTSQPQNLPASRGKSVVWLRVLLPAQESRESALFIPPVYLLMTVYLDGQVIYSFDDSEQARGLPWHLVDLPEGFAGKTLFLRIASDYTQLGLSGEVLIGPRSELIEFIINHDADRIVIGLLLAVVGLLALGFSPRRQEAVAYLAFGAYALCVAGWVLSHSYVKQFVLPYHTFWFYVWLVGLTGMVPSFVLYVEKVFGQGPWKVLLHLRRFYLVFVALLLTMYWLLGSTPLVTAGLNVMRVLLVLVACICVLQVGRQVLRGSRDAWIFLIGFCVLTLFAMHDVGVALDLIPEGRTLGHWGALILVLIMATILGVRFNDMFHRLSVYSKQLESSAREREVMVQDLHDGLGGMATNISLLAEVAQRQAENPQVIKTLETISGLSRESVSEIRGFMKSLDNAAADWPSFVADLRQYGTSTLEPHGIEFTLDEQIGSGAESPNSVLRLNVFRIYKEAVVNIVKHARAQRVGVELKVMQNQLVLTIHDDGVGIDNNKNVNNTNHDKGRGLGNIIARAIEMGGEACIDSNNGTQVVVIIPLPLKSPALGIVDKARS